MDFAICVQRAVTQFSRSRHSVWREVGNTDPFLLAPLSQRRNWPLTAHAYSNFARHQSFAFASCSCDNRLRVMTLPRHHRFPSRNQVPPNGTLEAPLPPVRGFFMCNVVTGMFAEARDTFGPIRWPVFAKTWQGGRCAQGPPCTKRSGISRLIL